MSYKKLYALFPDEHSEIDIKWSRPISYDKAIDKKEDEQENFFFYKIMAYSSRTGSYTVGGVSRKTVAPISFAFLVIISKLD